MIGLTEASLKARPDIAIFAHPTKITQRHVQLYLIGVADAPKGAIDFIAKVQKLEDGLILDGVDDDLGDKIIWQQLHQAHRSHQEEGEEIEKRRGGNRKAIKAEALDGSTSCQYNSLAFPCFLLLLP
jgi:hypothetical protein